MDNDEEFFSNFLDDDDMSDEEFLQVLDEASKYGVSAIQYHMRQKTFIPENYQLILNTLAVVGKIGGGSLQDGIDRLSDDYSDNVSSERPENWGKQSKGGQNRTIGYKRAIVTMVKQFQKENKIRTQEEAVIQLKDSDLLSITYDTFTNINKAVKVEDKILLAKVSKKISGTDEDINYAVELLKYTQIMKYFALLDDKIINKKKALDDQKTKTDSQLYNFIHSNESKWIKELKKN